MACPALKEGYARDAQHVNERQSSTQAITLRPILAVLSLACFAIALLSLKRYPYTSWCCSTVGADEIVMSFLRALARQPTTMADRL